MVDLPTLQRYKTLVKELALNEFTSRYQRTSLGLLWALISPAVLILTLSIAFSKLMRMEDVPHYGLLVVLGMILWNAFSEGTNLSVNSVLGKANLLGTVTFPVNIFVLASCIATFITFLISVVLYFMVLLVTGVDLSVHCLMVPLYMVELFFLIMGFSLLILSLSVRKRDIIHLWQLVMTVGFWLTPIIYTLERVPERLRPIFTLNPMARVITEIRSVVFKHEVRPLSEVVSTIAMIGAIFILGYLNFRRKATFLAEG